METKALSTYRQKRHSSNTSSRFKELKFSFGLNRGGNPNGQAGGLNFLSLPWQQTAASQSPRKRENQSKIPIPPDLYELLQVEFGKASLGSGQVNVYRFIEQVQNKLSSASFGDSKHIGRKINEELEFFKSKCGFNDNLSWKKLMKAFNENTCFEIEDYKKKQRVLQATPAITNNPPVSFDNLSCQEYGELLQQRGVDVSPLQHYIRKSLQLSHEEFNDDRSNSMCNNSMQSPALRSDEAGSFRMSTLRSELEQITKGVISNAPTVDQTICDRINVNGKRFQEDENWFENPAEELIEHRLMSIPVCDDVKVDSVLDGRSSEQVLIEKFNIPITKRLMQCLGPGKWLNDEIVNFYMCLLAERDSQLCEKDSKRIKSHFFNSFFISKLVCEGGYNYGNVKRWTKKVKVFEMKRIYFPINIRNTHWTIAVLSFEDKHIRYYDSMSPNGMVFLKGILRWLEDEKKDKENQSFDTSEWKLVEVYDCPKQHNGSDCGMFSIMCADFLSDDLPISESVYSQQNMPLFRRKVCASILNGKLYYPL